VILEKVGMKNDCILIKRNSFDRYSTFFIFPDRKGEEEQIYLYIECGIQDMRKYSFSISS